MEHLKSVEAEQYILGSVLRFGTEALDEAIEVIKSPAYFYHDRHQKIFSTMLNLYKSGQPCELLPFVENLDNETLLEFGGRVYLVEIMETAVSKGRVQYFAKILKEKYMLNQLILVCNQISQTASQPQADIDDVIMQAEKSLADIATGATKIDFIEKDKTTATQKEIDAYQTGTAQGRLIKTGIAGIDNIIGGFQPGQVIVVAGRTSHGKTQLALQIAEDVAIRQGRPTGIFSIEMPATRVVERLLFGRAGIEPRKKFIKDGLTPLDWSRLTNEAKRIEDSPLFIADCPSVYPFEIRALIRKAQYRHKLQLVIIDYLTLIRADSKVESRQQEVAYLSSQMRYIARDLNIPIIVISQLSREHQKRGDKTPQLIDIRESGAIEQDADIVIFCHHFKDNGLLQSQLIVAKHRDGETGVVPMFFEKGRWKEKELNRTEEYVDFHNHH